MLCTWTQRVCVYVCVCPTSGKHTKITHSVSRTRVLIYIYILCISISMYLTICVTHIIYIYTYMSVINYICAAYTLRIYDISMINRATMNELGVPMCIIILCYIVLHDRKPGHGYDLITFFTPKNQSPHDRRLRCPLIGYY